MYRCIFFYLAHFVACAFIDQTSMFWWLHGHYRPNAGVIEPKPLDPEIYSNMFTYAHLIDIAYCVSSVSQIEEPFACDLGCEKRFPNVTLVEQWYYDDSVAGYLATTYSNVFNYNLTDDTKPKKTVIVSLRGTRALLDSYTDIKMDMVGYNNMALNAPRCLNCRVHRGFHDYYRHLIEQIGPSIEKELETQDDYELLVLGHSLGGAVGAFVGLHFLDMGYDKLTLVTMGQPLLGNQEFVTWADTVLGSRLPIKHNTFSRKFFRVVHKEDVVTTIPKNGNLLDSYHQFDNQIYINCSATNTHPSPKRVIDCFDAENPVCIKKDFKDVFSPLSRNYVQIHTSYFRNMGLCGIKI